MRNELIDRRRAIEALRAGVPNRDVVRQLPPVQRDMEERYDALLTAAEAGWGEGKQAPGILLEGEFGTGKSHWLEYFRHLALEHNFICSTVVLNKETPLHDLAKIYRACVESAAAPGKTGPALEEIAHTYHSERAPHYQELFEWVHSTRDLDPRFAATLLLFAKNPREDLRELILAEWTGYPMRIGDMKRALREIEEAKRYVIERPLKGRLFQQFEFLSRFFYSAGYAGWVILLDEAEMISKYSVRQRGKAYAHLAQLLGVYRGLSIPGLATVFTITKDYIGEVLYGRKNDLEMVPAKLKGTRDEDYLTPAESGMKFIKGKGIELRSPTRAQVDEVYQKVRALYSQAYGWDAPEIDRREYSSSTGMRQHVRSWISTWDLRRLYDVQADLVVETVAPSYEEDADLQAGQTDVDDEPEIIL